MQATTGKQVHELFVERFNAQDADGIIELYEPNAVILPPEAPEVLSGHVAIREVLDGIPALGGKMENAIVRVIKQQDIAILVSIRKRRFSPNSSLRSKFYPRNINYMPAVKFFARLDLEEVSKDSEIPRFGMETILK